MFFLKFHKLDATFLAILTFVTLLLWWPTRMLPYWWDSAGYVMQAAKFYLDTNFSSFILPSDASISVMAHPPVFPFFLAIAWRIFGSTLFVSHLFYLPFVLAAVWGTYVLAKHIVAQFEDRTTARMSACAAGIFLLACPLFLAQVGIIYTEIPTAAFAVWAAYFFLQRNVRAYIAAASLMLLMKEVSAIIIVVFLAVLMWNHGWRLLTGQAKTGLFAYVKNVLRETALYASPCVVLAVWFAWHKIATGWLFALPYYEETFTQEMFGISWPHIQYALSYFFMEQLRWIITFGIGLALFIIFARWKMGAALQKAQYEGLALCTLAAVSVPLLFGKLEFLPRYLVFGLPFLFILFCVLLGHLLQFRMGSDPSLRISKKIVFVFCIVTISFFFTTKWDSHRKIQEFYFTPLEDNLEYIDVMRVGKQMVQFLEEQYPPEAIIYTAFPSNYMLSQPWQGYASKSLQVHNCDDYKEGDKVDVVVFHLLSPPQTNCAQIIRTLGLQSIKGFVYNGKWMEVQGRAPEEKEQE